MDETKESPERYRLLQLLNQQNGIYHHTVNVMIYSLMIGEKMGFNEKELVRLGSAALMHDVGKLDIPFDILNKTGKLNDEEFHIIKKHSEYGYKRLGKINDPIKMEMSIVAFQHHERLDGSGYPFGLKSEKIHPFSKIVAIADVYDALTEERVYRNRSFSPEEALAILKNGSGNKFDSKFLNALCLSLTSSPFKIDPYKNLIKYRKLKRAI